MHHILTLRTITPLHSGTGQAVGTTDLPIARERVTNWPYVPGSSVKGVLRDAASVAWIAQQEGARRTKNLGKQAGESLTFLFGSSERDNQRAGSLAVSDLRLLLFPVRSLVGSFAYATCQLALGRANELLEVAGRPKLPEPVATGEHAVCAADSKLVTDRQVIFEDLVLAAESGADSLVSPLANLTGIPAVSLQSRLAVVSDDLFTFLNETATEVVTHVSLDFETRTAIPGHLRSEERVPAEAVFVGLARLDDLLGKPEDSDKSRSVLAQFNDQPYLQFGGKASVGNGLCKVGFTL